MSVVDDVDVGGSYFSWFGLFCVEYVGVVVLVHNLCELNQ
jgi:hypothetical protein